jgi:uncharacterized membrane protein (UPF0127 family)
MRPSGAASTGPISLAPNRPPPLDPGQARRCPSRLSAPAHFFDILVRPRPGGPIGLLAMNSTRLTGLTIAALATAAIAAALCLPPAGAQPAGPVLPTRSLTAGIHLITAEVAADDRSRELGLMNRPGLEPNHGMLFVFDPAFKACMWMRNTLIPLSVAFIDAGGRVVNIEDMQAQTDQIHCARREVPFALEMARGWFAERGLKPGETVIGGLPQPAQAAK